MRSCRHDFLRILFEISHFLTVIEFNTKYRMQKRHRETYLILAFRAQYEGKMELPLIDMVSFS